MSNGDNQSRRQVLQSVGVTAAALSGSKVVNASENTVEIPIEQRGTEYTRWKEVPEDWWQFEQKAQRIQKKLADKFRDNPAIRGVGIGTINQRIAGRNQSKVRVYKSAKTPAKQAPDLPNSMNGVKVATERPPKFELDECPNPDTWCHDDCYGTIAGGVRLEQGWTATTTVYYDSNPYVLTCGHPYWDVDNCDPSVSDTVNHCDDGPGSIVGDIADFNRSLDYVLVGGPSSELEMSQSVHYTDSKRLDVSGNVTKEGLHDMKSTDEEMYMYGAKSCRRSGVIQGYTEDLPYDDSNCTEDNVFIETTACTSPGDSGSPYYRTWKDPKGCEWASIIGLHSGAESYGPAAYRLTDEGIKFGVGWEPCGKIT